MSAHVEATIRTARRLDTAPLTDLRVAYLSEVARLEPRLKLLPDVRNRTEHTLPVWIDQVDRTLLVAELRGPEATSGPLVGYATGVATVWPPVYRNQHVGEVGEIYVHPDHRGTGIGQNLLSTLTRTLLEAGVGVLRAPVPVRNDVSLARFLALGYRPLQYVLQKALEDA